MITIHSAFKDIEARLKLRPLSLEFEILVALYQNGPMPSSRLMGLTHGSIATFNGLLRGLVARGLVVATKDETDRRVRNYDLDVETRRLLDERLVEVFRRLATCAAVGSVAMDAEDPAVVLTARRPIAGKAPAMHTRTAGNPAVAWDRRVAPR